MKIILVIALLGYEFVIGAHDTVAECVAHMEEVQALETYRGEELWCEPKKLPVPKPDYSREQTVFDHRGRAFGIEQYGEWK